MHLFPLFFTTLFTFQSCLRWTFLQLFMNNAALLYPKEWAPCVRVLGRGWPDRNTSEREGERGVCVCDGKKEKGSERERGRGLAAADSVCQQPHGFSPVCVMTARDSVCVCICVFRRGSEWETLTTKQRERRGEHNKERSFLFGS